MGSKGRECFRLEINKSDAAEGVSVEPGCVLGPQRRFCEGWRDKLTGLCPPVLALGSFDVGRIFLREQKKKIQLPRTASSVAIFRKM